MITHKNNKDFDDYLLYLIDTYMKYSKYYDHLKLYDKDIKFIPSACNWFHVKESDLGKLPDNIVFRKNCIIPERGDDWVRLGITDNIKDYDWILK